RCTSPPTLPCTTLPARTTAWVTASALASSASSRPLHMSRIPPAPARTTQGWAAPRCATPSSQPWLGSPAAQVHTRTISTRTSTWGTTQTNTTTKTRMRQGTSQTHTPPRPLPPQPCQASARTHPARAGTPQQAYGYN
ncbi:hypothetical protein H0H87_004672, partial [Tephrocybe sp. NHM501043]